MAPRSQEAPRSQVDELGTGSNADAGTTQAAGRVPLEMPEPVPEKAEEHEEKAELPNTGKPASVLAPTETTQTKASTLLDAIIERNNERKEEQKIRAAEKKAAEKQQKQAAALAAAGVQSQLPATQHAPPTKSAGATPAKQKTTPTKPAGATTAKKNATPAKHTATPKAARNFSWRPWAPFRNQPAPPRLFKSCA